MDNLKEILFSRTLMYRNKMKSATVSDIGAYSAAYLAVSLVIAEAGLDEEFQQYKSRMEVNRNEPVTNSKNQSVRHSRKRV